MRFFGKVGYVLPAEQTSPGVYKEPVVERPYYGDVERNSRTLPGGEKVNNDLSVSNSISIVADAYANEHFHAIRYVEWAGALWTVTTVDADQRPRLLLRLGGLYHGSKA